MKQYRVKSAFVFLIASSLFAANCSGKAWKNLLDKYSGADGQTPPSVTQPGGGSGTGSLQVQAVLAIDNTTVRVVFNKAVDQTLANTVGNYSINNSLSVISAQRDATNSATVTLITSSQTGGTTYTVTVANLVAVDTSTLDATLKTGTFTGISAADTLAPTLTNATSLATTSVKLTFSESVDATTAGTTTNFEFHSNSTCTAAVLGTNPTAAARDGANLSAINLTTNAQSASVYYVKVTGVKDLAGNTMAAGTCFAFNGTGADATAPTVSSVAQISSTQIRVTFSEAVSAATGQTTTNYSVSPVIGAANPTTAVRDSLNTNIVYLTYGTAMTGNTTYSVTVTNVQDLSGNTIVNNGTTNKGSFFYPATDSISPTVVSAVAQDNTKVLVTFSEAVQQTTAETAANYTISGLTITTAVRQTNTSQVLLTVSSQSATSYTVTVANVQDAAGNIVGNPNNASFTGDAVPSVQSIIAVSNTKIRVIFSEVMASAGITTDYTIPGLTVTVATLLTSPNNNVVELTTTAQTGGTSYTLTVGNGSATIKDSTNNLLSATANSAAFSGDGKPTVTAATSPNPTTVQVTFSEAVETATATTSTNYVIGGCTAGTMAVTSAALSSATTVLLGVTPTGVTNGSTCTVTVSNVKDLNTNVIGGSNTANFTYATADTTVPYLSSVAPTSNTVVRVTFNENVDISSAGFGAHLAANYAISGGLTVASVNCVSQLVCDLTTSSQNFANYTLTVSNIKDTAGNVIGTPASMTFTGIAPADTTAPTVLLAQVQTGTSVKVYFSEAVDLTTAQTTGNYAINNGLTVSSAVRQADPTIVLLTVSAMTSGTSYTVTVTGVKDLANNTISGSNTATFTGIDTTYPYVTGSSSTGNTTVDVTFSEPVNQTDAQTTSNYSLVVNATGTALTVSAATRDGTNLNVVHLTTASQSAVTYRITATGIRDLSNNTIVNNGSTNIALFTGTAVVTTPTVTAAAAQSSTKTRVTFSESMTAATSECANATACSSIYTIPGLTITASVSTAGSGVNAATYDLTTAEQSEGTSYTVTVASGTAKSVSSGTAVGSTNNTGTFTGDGRPTVTTTTSTSCTVVDLTFDQAMTNGTGTNTSVDFATNYQITACTNNGGGCTGASQTATGATWNAGTKKATVTFPTTMSGSGDVYTVQISNARDTTANAITTATKTFNGCAGADTIPPTLSSASAPDATHVLLTFSEPVDQTTAETAGNYALSGSLTVSAAVRQTNTAQVLLTSSTQGGGNYSVTVTGVKDIALNTIVANGVTNIKPFTGAGSGGTPQNFDAGPVFSNPFNDNVKTGQIFVYGGKLYVGPSTSHGSIFEMSYDMGTSTTITLDGDGTAGAPYTTFAGLANASGTNLGGIDYFYSGCTGASPATLTGTGCSGAGGTEISVIGGYITSGGNYQSAWLSNNPSGSTWTFSQTSGLETGGNALRSMAMGLFKDQLYVALQDQGGGAIKFSRMCAKAGGCANGDTYGQVTQLKGSRLNHMGAAGTNANGQNGKLIAIDTMWEYDNDGTGGNESQLYIANGGSTNGVALPSTSGATKDGGILRTHLTYSTTANPPPQCASTAACDGYWSDVTPTNAKWLAYMSIALPKDARGDGTCSTITVGTTEDWDCLVPQNKITPSIKAIPIMRTAPNGDLYMIRNACSSTTVQTLTTSVTQTCPSGSEIPQLWMLPKGTTGAPKGAGDWILVAEAGTTGRTDMSQNTGSCGTAPNKCLNNTHITALEINGSYMYLGYDNGTNGLNLWRVNLSAVASQGNGSLPSGTAPIASDFSQVSTFGLTGTNKATPDYRIFSHISVSDGGVDYLVITSGTGTGAVNIFRTKNN